MLDMKALCWPVIKFALMDPDAAASPMVAGSADNASNSSDTGKPQPVPEFYDQFSEPAYRYLLSLRLSPETAEDLVHESFLRLHRALGEKKVRTDCVRAWLFRVAHNLAISLNGVRRCLSFHRRTHLTGGHTRIRGDPETAVLHEEWVLRLHRASISAKSEASPRPGTTPLASNG
jgi:DNA-directed RNA polymerase specialized sigma24 family protein